MILFVLIIKALLETSIIISICFTITLISIFIAERVQVRYENWKLKKCIQRLDKKHEEVLQQSRKIELQRKEREKYPLFYWRELCEQRETYSEQRKEGIV